MRAGLRSGPRVGGLGLAVAMAALVAVGCNDFVDPPTGHEFTVALEGPDTVVLGDEALMTLKVYDATGRPVAGLPIRWELAQNPLLAESLVMESTSAPDQVLVRALRTGSAFVRGQIFGPATDGNPAAAFTMWAAAQGVRITSGDQQKRMVLNYGATDTLLAVALGVDGTPVPGGTSMRWAASSDVVRLSDGGSPESIAVSANRIGQTRVTASPAICVGVCVDTLHVEVVQIPTAVTADEVPDLGYLGEARPLTGRVTDALGQTVHGSAISWSLANAADTAVVTLHGDTVTALANGTATIVASAGELTDTVEVVVWQLVGRVRTDAGVPHELVVGATDTLTVLAYDPGPVFGSLLERPFSVSATSSDPAVVQVTPLGERVEVTGAGEGRAGFNVVVEGAGRWVEVVVNPLVDSLRITLERDTLNHVNDATQAAVTGYLDGSPLVLRAAFSSSAPAVAEVGSQGYVVARGAGEAWIRGSAGGHVDSALVTVRQVLATLSIRPDRPIIASSGGLLFEPVGLDSAGYPLASVTATFESTAPDILLVDAGGSGTAVDTGTATVQARSGDHIAYAHAAVIPPVTGAALGTNHLCLLGDDGRVFCLGGNGAGQLGDGTTTPRTVPAEVSGGTKFVQVVAGVRFSCGLAADGRTLCWGSDTGGKLGTGGGGDSAVPVAVSGDPGFVHLTAAAYHVCGLTATGSAYCWGENVSGQTGVGHDQPVSVPTAVAGGHTFVALEAGPTGACGVDDQGVAYCWGFLDAKTVEPTALSAPLAMTAVSGLRCALGDDDALYCRSGLSLEPVLDGRSYRALDAGVDHECAMQTDGAVYCFGFNGSGRLGTGDYDNRLLPTRVLLAGSATYVVGGWVATCAGNDQGGLACWGALPEAGWDSPYPSTRVYP